MGSLNQGFHLYMYIIHSLTLLSLSLSLPFCSASERFKDDEVPETKYEGMIKKEEEREREKGKSWCCFSFAVFLAKPFFV